MAFDLNSLLTGGISPGWPTPNNPMNSIQGYLAANGTQLPSGSSGSSGGFNLNSILGSLGNVASGIGSIFSGNSPYSPLAGLGLIGAGAALDREPGYAVEARQRLRNQFTSPEDPFASGGLYSRYLPALQQQESDVFNALKQRYSSFFPSSITAPSGAELSAAGQFAARAAQNRQSLIANILQQNTQNQLRAAEDLLGYAKPDPLAGALGGLGSQLLLGGGGAGGSTAGGGGVGGAGSLAQKLLGGLGGGGSSPYLNQALDAVGLANKTGNTQPLEQLLFSGALQGMPFPVGIAAESPAGQILQQAINRGLVESPAAQVLGGGSSGIGGLLSGGGGGLSSFLSGVGGMLGPLALLGGAGFLGSKVGANAPNAALAGLSGGGAGAISGALLGATSLIPGVGPLLGAVLGGGGGILGGLFGQHRANVAMKAKRRAADLASQDNNLSVLGSFWTDFMGQVGVDPSEYGNFVDQQLAANAGGPGAFSFQGISGSADQPDAVTIVGSRLALDGLNAARQQSGQAPYSSWQQVPGFRDVYVNYLNSKLRVESGGGQRPVSGVGEYYGYLSDIGLS